MIIILLLKYNIIYLIFIYMSIPKFNENKLDIILNKLNNIIDEEERSTFNLNMEKLKEFN